MSYGEVSGLWAGGSLDFGGPETGRSIIGAAEARYERWISNTMEANRLNQLTRKGKLTREEAKERIAGKDDFSIENYQLGVRPAICDSVRPSLRIIRMQTSTQSYSKFWYSD